MVDNMVNSLKNLLREADSKTAAIPGAKPSVVAGSVLNANRLFKTRRVLSAVALTLVGSLAALAVVHHSNLMHPLDNQSIATSLPAAVPPDAEHLEEMSRIRAEIAESEAAIARLLLAEKQQHLDVELARLQRLPTADDVTETAAAAMVYQTDRMLQSTDLTQPAREAYNQVISYFPQTISANTARKRLSEIGTQG